MLANHDEALAKLVAERSNDRVEAHAAVQILPRFELSERAILQAKPATPGLALNNQSIATPLTAVDGKMESPDASPVPKRFEGRAPPLDMFAIGLKPGDVLRFVHQSSITATVAGSRKIEIEGQVMKLSPAVKLVMRRLNRATPSEAYQGPDYWIFGGETLTARRARLGK